VCVA